MMRFTLKKTDKRHNGNQFWQYIVIIEKAVNINYGRQSAIQKANDLNQIREWCWETYGPSCELDFWLMLDDSAVSKNDKWCWHTNFDNFKIYLRTEKEANWFKLKWL